jgi:hypothetical protein
MRSAGLRSAIGAVRNVTAGLMRNGSTEIRTAIPLRRTKMTDPYEGWDEAKAIAKADDADEAWARELELQFEYPDEEEES